MRSTAQAWKNFKGMRRVQAEFKHLSEDVQAGKFGFLKDLELVDENMLLWRFKLHNFDNDLAGGKQLNADLCQLQSMYGQGHLLMEIQFPKDYPHEPFFIRVVSPRCHLYTGHVTAGGSICLEALTNSGTAGSWQHSFSVESLLNVIVFNMLDCPIGFVQTATGPGGRSGPLRIDFRHGNPLKGYSNTEAKMAFSRTLENHKRMGWGGPQDAHNAAGTAAGAWGGRESGANAAAGSSGSGRGFHQSRYWSAPLGQAAALQLQPAAGSGRRSAAPAGLGAGGSGRLLQQQQGTSAAVPPGWCSASAVVGAAAGLVPAGGGRRHSVHVVDSDNDAEVAVAMAARISGDCWKWRARVCTPAGTLGRQQQQQPPSLLSLPAHEAAAAARMTNAAGAQGHQQQQQQQHHASLPLSSSTAAAAVAGPDAHAQRKRKVTIVDLVTSTPAAAAAPEAGAGEPQGAHAQHSCKARNEELGPASTPQAAAAAAAVGAGPEALVQRKRKASSVDVVNLATDSEDEDNAATAASLADACDGVSCMGSMRRSAAAVASAAQGAGRSISVAERHGLPDSHQAAPGQQQLGNSTDNWQAEQEHKRRHTSVRPGQARLRTSDDSSDSDVDVVMDITGAAGAAVGIAPRTVLSHAGVAALTAAANCGSAGAPPGGTSRQWQQQPGQQRQQRQQQVAHGPSADAIVLDDDDDVQVVAESPAGNNAIAGPSAQHAQQGSSHQYLLQRRQQQQRRWQQVQQHTMQQLQQRYQHVQQMQTQVVLPPPGVVRPQQLHQQLQQQQWWVQTRGQQTQTQQSNTQAQQQRQQAQLPAVYARVHFDVQYPTHWDYSQPVARSTIRLVELPLPHAAVNGQTPGRPRTPLEAAAAAVGLDSSDINTLQNQGLSREDATAALLLANGNADEALNKAFDSLDMGGATAVWAQMQSNAWQAPHDQQQADEAAAAAQHIAEEVEGVLARFEQTSGGSLTRDKVLCIERVQHARLWRRYCLRRLELVESRGAAGLHEQMLFHGSGPSTIDTIASEGFDFRLVTSAAYGNGCYFADHSSTAATFSQSKAMIAARASSMMWTMAPLPPPLAAQAAGLGATLGSWAAGSFSGTAANNMPVSVNGVSWPANAAGAAAATAWTPGITATGRAKVNKRSSRRGAGQQTTTAGATAMATAYQPGTYKMILARVALGMQATGQTGMRKPPAGYDSVNSGCAVTTQGQQSFYCHVIFENDQAYPEYVITFR